MGWVQRHVTCTRCYYRMLYHLPTYLPRFLEAVYRTVHTFSKQGFAAVHSTQRIWILQNMNTTISCCVRRCQFTMNILLYIQVVYRGITYRTCHALHSTAAVVFKRFQRCTTRLPTGGGGDVHLDRPIGHLGTRVCSYKYQQYSTSNDSSLGFKPGMRNVRRTHIALNSAQPHHQSVNTASTTDANSNSVAKRSPCSIPTTPRTPQLR